MEKAVAERCDGLRFLLFLLLWFRLRKVADPNEEVTEDVSCAEYRLFEEVVPEVTQFLEVPLYSCRAAYDEKEADGQDQ